MAEPSCCGREWAEVEEGFVFGDIECQVGEPDGANSCYVASNAVNDAEVSWKDVCVS